MEQFPWQETELHCIIMSTIYDAPRSHTVIVAVDMGKALDTENAHTHPPPPTSTTHTHPPSLKLHERMQSIHNI